jgi:hypothetical protein
MHRMGEGNFRPSCERKAAVSGRISNRGEGRLILRDRIKPAAQVSDHLSDQNVAPAFTM